MEGAFMILRREGIHDACRWIRAMCVQGVNGGSGECCTWSLGGRRNGSFSWLPSRGGWDGKINWIVILNVKGN
jgi:hypothetical protein